MTHTEGLSNKMWSVIAKNPGISESFLRKHSYKIDCWLDISSRGDLSYQFIREFADRVVWTAICVYQNVSDNLVREFKGVYFH